MHNNPAKSGHHGGIRIFFLTLTLLCLQLVVSVEEDGLSSVNIVTEELNVENDYDSESRASRDEESTRSASDSSDNSQQTMMTEQKEQGTIDSRTVEGSTNEGCAALIVEAPEDGK